jgi:hypothetical protein
LISKRTIFLLLISIHTLATNITMSTSLQTYTSYALLPALSAVGAFGTTILAQRSGLFNSIIANLKQRPALLPNSKARLIRKWTHVPPVDNLLGFLVTFFWPVVDGKDATISFQSRHFAGQLIAIWSLIEMEGVRSGDKLSSHVVIAGMGVQLLGAAVAIPLWCALHLASYFPVQSTIASLATEQNLAAAPYAVTLGLLLPVAFMTVTRHPGRKQFWIVMFQIYPILTYLATRLLSGRLASSSSEDSISNMYAYATTISLITHLACFGPSVASILAPGMFTAAKAAQLNPLKAFLPRFGLTKRGDMVEARLNFLRWDEAVSVGSFVIWAVVRYISSLPEADVNTVVIAKLGAQVLGRAMVLGPVGAAVWLLKETKH